MPPDKNANGCGEAELNENSNIDNRFVCNAWPSYATSITKQKKITRYMHIKNLMIPFKLNHGSLSDWKRMESQW